MSELSRKTSRSASRNVSWNLSLSTPRNESHVRFRVHKASQIAWRSVVRNASRIMLFSCKNKEQIKYKKNNNLRDLSFLFLLNCFFIGSFLVILVAKNKDQKSVCVNVRVSKTFKWRKKDGDFKKKYICLKKSIKV